MTPAQSQRVNRIINDLATSIRTDVLPIIQPTNPEGGYFGVPRTILCYIDFLGLLLAGWRGKKNKKGVKDDFATPQKAKDYIKDVLSKVDKLYGTNGDLLYEMYRHGTVHIYSPKKMVSEGSLKRTIEWLIYKGDREQWDYLETKAVKFRHLQIMELEKNRFILPVSIVALYRDLLVSIELYKEMIYKDKTERLLKNLLSIADALDQDFDITPHKLWKGAVKIS